jgi:3-hydroxyisobutyrate dehydrogenase-like beta-hydroxyacid dehydrogenase
MNLGFIGLGNMGKAIASNLLKTGNELLVYNRTKSKAAELESAGAKLVDRPADLGQADVIFSMLADDPAVESVILDPADGLLSSLKKNAIHISLSTISVALSQKLNSKHKESGSSYLAAPVFGRPPAAQAAQLVLVVAGDAACIDRCAPLLNTIGRKVVVMGNEPHMANIVKLSGNFMIASILEALGESCALARKSGVDQKQFLELICGDLFPSPILKAYQEVIGEQRFTPAGFAMHLGLKDLRLVLAAAESAQVPMPVASIVRDHFLSGLARGKGESDWSALAEIAAENAGLK